MICPHCSKDTEEQPINKTPKEIKIMSDNIYKEYPKKQGKPAGFRKLAIILKRDPKLYDEIMRAVVRYRADIIEKDTQQHYIKMFSTFINNWEDFGDENYADMKSTTTVTGSSDWSNPFS